MTHDRMLPPEEVCGILGIDVRTLRSWRQAGTGPPATRLGKYLRYSAAELQSWIERQKVNSTRRSA